LSVVVSPPHAQRPGSAAGLLSRIEPGARQGLQQQVFTGIRRAILDGTLALGTRLPSSRALAEDLGVSRTTTMLAYEQLTAEGFLAARHGSGTFVTRELPEDLPYQPPVTRDARTKHPQLSGRGATLATTTAAGQRRIVGAPRPFRAGVPALDLFPMRLWSRLVSHRLRSTPTAQLDYTDSAGLTELRSAIAEHVQASRATRCD